MTTEQINAELLAALRDANIPLWKSYVFHGGKCFFVSTIQRTYDTHAGCLRGQETLVWEYDWDTSERGKLIHQAGSIADHQTICLCIIAEGECPDEYNPSHVRFFDSQKAE